MNELPEGFILYCDGSKQRQQTRYGFVLTIDKKTLFSGVGLVPYVFSQDSNTAEFYAIGAGMWDTLKNGFSGINLYVSDNSGAIDNLNKSEMKTGHHHFRLYRSIHQLMKSFNRITFIWIPRKLNREADRIASFRNCARRI